MSGFRIEPSLSLYWHTLRHLKPGQIYGRAWFSLARPRVDLRPAPAMRDTRGGWVLPARRQASLLSGGRFCFLNETRELAAYGWDDVTLDKLWRYNLHYFDDLNARDAELRANEHRILISRWVQENPPAAGTGWEPYPCSLRIVNWIKWSLSGNSLPSECVLSLAVQTRWLSQRLEEHLLGNHLYANAKALVFGGLFFQGEEASRWLDEGMAILARETPEQILDDGGQFERSPMYHALALEDILDLINITTAFRAAVPDKWRALVESWPGVARKMRDWLRVMCHPDGEISFFNDAAIGIAPSLGELERYTRKFVGESPRSACHLHDGSDSAREALRVVQLARSGYVRADVPNAALFIDVATLGPDHLPGHAHADTLSLELSLFGQRLIVNGGTSRYGRGLVREAERGTPAHSTVTIDGENSSEVWAAFRVARRARPLGLTLNGENERLRVSCAHDGYRRLSGRPVHRRTWLFQPGSLRVEDRVEGRFRSAVARFHLHPRVECASASGSSGRLHLPQGQTVQWRTLAGAAYVEPSSYSPQFGRRVPTKCLAVHFGWASESCMEFSW